MGKRISSLLIFISILSICYSQGFTNINAGLTGTHWGDVAWGDYDGDLDLICSGYDDVGGSNTIIYKNENGIANTVPTAPENLIVDIIDNNVLLIWDTSSDNETPSAGLSYNAYIRSESGDVIWNSMSLVSDGTRFLPTLGNAQQNTEWFIDNLPEGNYFCSVQAIDHTFAGSAFSDEVPFNITFVGVDDRVPSENTANLSNYPNPFNQSTTISYNTLDAGFIQIDIFDINGRRVYSLVNEDRNKGSYYDVWNGESNTGKHLDSGVYYYILRVNGVFISKDKCLLLR